MIIFDVSVETEEREDVGGAAKNSHIAKIAVACENKMRRRFINKTLTNLGWGRGRGGN